MTTLCVKTADNADELEQVHALNYRIFVEEIQQHPANEQRLLIDRFNHANHYIVAKRGSKVTGMVSYNLTRPFSLDESVENLDSYLPPGKKIAEVRLLALEKSERHATTTFKLIRHLCGDLLRLEVDLGVIKGILQQRKLYDHLGFRPFGPVVGAGTARFQPMYITALDLYEAFKQH